MPKIILIMSILFLNGAFAKAAQKYQIPFEAILEASLSIEPATGSVYSASGILNCRSVSSEFPPYVPSQTCVISIKEKIISLDKVDGVTQEDVDSLLEALIEIEPATGPFYEFNAPFTVQLTNTGMSTATSSATVYIN